MKVRWCFAPEPTVCRHRRNIWSPGKKEREDKFKGVTTTTTTKKKKKK